MTLVILNLDEHYYCPSQYCLFGGIGDSQRDNGVSVKSVLIISLLSSTSVWYNTIVNEASSQALGETNAGLRESWAESVFNF